MTWLRHLGWAIYALATLAAAAAVYLVHLPAPTDAIVITRATYSSGDGPDREVALPHRTAPRLGARPQAERFLVHFDLAELPAEPLFMLVPTINRRVLLLLKGAPLFDTDVRALWSGPVVGGSALVHLPHALLAAGRNEVTVVLERPLVAMPSYLSELYVGTEAALVPNYRLRVLFEDRLKTMALAAHVLLGIGIFIAFFNRPQDPLFSWFAAMVALSFVLSFGMFGAFQPSLEELLPYILVLSSTIGFLAVGVALASAGVSPPRWLRRVTLIGAAASVLSVATGLIADRVLLVFIHVPLLLVGMSAATIIAGWGAFRRDSTEARVMLSPFFITTWFLIRDTGAVVGLIDGPLMVAPYARTFFLAAITIVLMRRLALSLEDLDRANENLNRRLAEREAELDALHQQERIKAARAVREQERRRLTHDLHDGISGHLVSIIAMSEQTRGDVRPIEQAARAALDDLRLVIYSLDLGDRELPLALANFRERLIPQLQRIGVELDWSIAQLPEVSGVTPGNALTVLRILQEAITNALKHGPARRIAIRGAAAPDGRASISIENDGRPFVPGAAGLGLANMRRRAGQLHGELQIVSLDHGVRVTLLLPARLPDLQEVAAE